MNNATATQNNPTARDSMHVFDSYCGRATCPDLTELRTVLSCPAWCELPEGHEAVRNVAGDGTFIHRAAHRVLCDGRAEVSVAQYVQADNEANVSHAEVVFETSEVGERFTPAEVEEIHAALVTAYALRDEINAQCVAAGIYEKATR